MKLKNNYMNIQLWGITGKKRSGKDTVAELLINKYNFQRYSFADPIKKAAMEMFGFSHEQMWGSAEEKETVDSRWNISPRRMLQLLGTELFQYDIHKYLNEGEFNVGRAVWVYRFKLWFEEEKEKHIKENKDFKIVISDVRFIHEVEAIRNLGGQILEVSRPSISSVDTHASENELDSIIPDFKFMNNGTIDDLYLKIDEYINSQMNYA